MQSDHALLLGRTVEPEDPSARAAPSLAAGPAQARVPDRDHMAEQPLFPDASGHLSRYCMPCFDSLLFDHLCQAGCWFLHSLPGTYVKEFVHGDMGRTSPSIASLLNCQVGRFVFAWSVSHRTVLTVQIPFHCVNAG
jgi:hypothetical protein